MRLTIAAMPRPARRVRLAAGAALLLLAGCRGGTLDAVYPDTLAHDPPPAVNLPPQDQGMGITTQQPGNHP